MSPSVRRRASARPLRTRCAPVRCNGCNSCNESPARSEERCTSGKNPYAGTVRGVPRRAMGAGPTARPYCPHHRARDPVTPGPARRVGRNPRTGGDGRTSRSGRLHSLPDHNRRPRGMRRRYPAAHWSFSSGPTHAFLMEPSGLRPRPGAWTGARAHHRSTRRPAYAQGFGLPSRTGTLLARDGRTYTRSSGNRATHTRKAESNLPLALRGSLRWRAPPPSCVRPVTGPPTTPTPPPDPSRTDSNPAIRDDAS